MNNYIFYINSKNDLNESLSLIVAFMKARTAIKKYFKAKTKFAQEFISDNKSIDKETENKGKLRDAALKKYESKEKSLETLHKQIKEIIKENSKIQPLYNMHELQYKIKVGRLGLKNKVSLAKLKGIGDNIDDLSNSDIKQEETKVNDAIDGATDKAENEIKKTAAKVKKIKNIAPEEKEELKDEVNKIAQVDPKQAKELATTIKKSEETEEKKEKSETEKK
jgi:hypothetical protein